jgi:hypothetical protein
MKWSLEVYNEINNKYKKKTCKSLFVALGSEPPFIRCFIIIGLSLAVA